MKDELKMIIAAIDLFLTVTLQIIMILFLQTASSSID